MSISQAPSATHAAPPRRPSPRPGVAPSGKPTTVQTWVSEPRSSSAHSGTQTGFTQTVAKPCSRASAHSVSICSRRGVGLEQRVVDQARDLPRVESAAGLEAEALGAVAEQAAHAVGAAAARGGVARAGRLRSRRAAPGRRGRSPRPAGRPSFLDSSPRSPDLGHAAGVALLACTCCARNVSTISCARGRVQKRAPSVSTFASLCSRAFCAAAASTHSAARTPGTLFAAIAEPMPAPSTRMPSARLPAPHRARHRQRQVRVVHRLRREGPEVAERTAQARPAGLLSSSLSAKPPWSAPSATTREPGPSGPGRCARRARPPSPGPRGDHRARRTRAARRPPAPPARPRR